MRAYTRRRLLASVKLGVAGIPFATLLRVLHGDPVVPGTFLTGFAFGFFVGIAELFWLRSRLKGLGFISHLVVKSLAITAIIYVSFAVLNLLDVTIEGITWEQYAEAVFAPDLLGDLAEALAVIAFLLFFVQLDRLLGPGVLLGYVTGRYHQPRREQRIFMFLDLKGSTAIADGMEADRYFAFLHQYFTEMSEPILETDAEIYQYVGDEVVLTWRMKAGLEEANCVRAFFLIRDQIRAHAPDFERRYGVVPEFKAGMHAGEVITAQIGELKSEIVYNGDVLNTTARIQAACAELGRELLVSATLVDRLALDGSYSVERLGAVALRGKKELVELCAITQDNPEASWS
jgi:adenylate cyclase